MAETNDMLAALMASLREGELDFGQPVAETRAYFDGMLAGMPVAEDLTFTPGTLAGLPALHTASPGAAEDAVLLYLHGGAYISGTTQGYRGLAAELARAAGARGIALDYRLAPEHPFPAAVEDAVAGYEALLERGFAPGRIVLAGDSAGGGLTAATLIALRDKGVPLPAAALLISPWADLTGNAASHVTKAAEDPTLTAEALRISADYYLGGGSAEHPLASPVLADFTGLPPILIQVGSIEVLLDDSLALAAAAGRANAPVRLEIWPQMPHVWHAFAFMLPEGRKAIETAGAFLAGAMTEA
ncbi:MAG: alpha/beta hydrolase [Novosphingobium sp.]